ncbi:MAG: sigma-70 region 4 domain-containing protein [Candidatus Poribacteria bacterium]|nr:sigma-70 region 4 domain-containing protein [Candidatus Poribacteria bacterium]
MKRDKPQETSVWTGSVAFDEVFVPSWQGYDPAGRSESLQFLHLLRSKLSSRDHQIFLWKELHGYTNKEIAERLGVKSASTIRTWLDRARRTLKADASFQELAAAS